MYGLSRTSSFGLTMKLLTYQPTTTDHGRAHRGRHERGNQPAQPRPHHGVDERRDGAERERDGDDEQAGERHVRVRVGHAGKHRVIREQPVEAARGRRARPASAARQRTRSTGRATHQHLRTCSPCWSRRVRLVPSLRQQLRAARDGDEERRDRADDDGERQDPAGHELPHRQREQIEDDGPAENRIDRRPTRPARASTRQTAATRPSCRRRSRHRRTARRRSR